MAGRSTQNTCKALTNQTTTSIKTITSNSITTKITTTTSRTNTTNPMVEVAVKLITRAVATSWQVAVTQVLLTLLIQWNQLVSTATITHLKIWANFILTINSPHKTTITRTAVALKIAVIQALITTPPIKTPTTVVRSCLRLLQFKYLQLPLRPLSRQQ